MTDHSIYDLRVMFDPQIFCHQRFGGISRYICSIALAMQSIEGVNPRIVAPFHFNEYLAALPPVLARGRRVRWLEGLTALAYGASVIPGKLAAQAFKPHVLHNTYYFPIKPPKGSQSILTVYDMIHERFPEFFLSSPFISRIKAASVAAADHVICISENTRRDVLATYDIPEERVSVTHLGFDPLASFVSRETPEHLESRVIGSDPPYLLYVGSRAKYKNFNGLLDAFAESHWLNRNFFLVCFGGGNFTNAELSSITEAGVTDRVKHVAGSDAVLARCYANASLFVFPSFYEGFGIPVLEAMSLNCPVACSNSSSLPEVVGDAAQLFDPDDRDSVRIALETVLNSQSYAETLKERGRIRCQQFSWSACAEKTVGIYRRIVDGRS